VCPKTGDVIPPQGDGATLFSLRRLLPAAASIRIALLSVAVVRQLFEQLFTIGLNIQQL